MSNVTEQIFLPSSSGSQAPPGLPKPGNGLPPVNLDSVEDFTKVCRVCAAITELVMPIFSGEGLQNNLADKIHKYLPIKVCESDSPGLPVVVCYQCASTLLATHELVTCSAQADAALRTRSAALAARAAARLVKQEKKRAAEEIDATADTDPCEPRPRGSAPSRSSDEADWPGACASSDDDRPLATVAAERAEDLYDAFYTALCGFREHVLSSHAARPAYPEFSSSSSASSGRSRAAVDDLPGALRRGRLDDAARLALARARVREAGRVLYACAECGKRLSSAHTFVFHRRIHTGERPCVCHVCGKQFRAPNGLQRHVAETHERRRRRACRHCGRTFANSQNLKQHLRTHTGERPYACALCPKRFAHAGSLHAHRKTHSAARPHRCAHCPAAFRLRAGLARHRRAHRAAPRAPPAAPHACAACAAAFRSRRALRHHARQHAPPEHAPPASRPYFVLAPLTERRCAFCPTRLPAARYREHLELRHAAQLFHCDECDRYVSRRVFFVHMTTHAAQYEAAEQEERRRARPDLPPPAPTPTQQLASALQALLRPAPAARAPPGGRGAGPRAAAPAGSAPAARARTRGEPPRPAAPAAAPPAGEPLLVFTPLAAPAPAGPGAPPGAAAADEFSDHSDAEFGPLPDSVFSAIEDSQDARAPEPAAAAGPAGRKRERACPHCDKKYTAASSYFYHLKYFHKRSREHACGECGARFGTRGALREHAGLHGGERALQCGRCGKRFRSKASLYIHAQTHGAAKAWACAQCGRAFRWRAQLRRHLARHAGARAHACPHCARAFSVRADLLRHARTHAQGPARLACPAPGCGATFAQPRYLRAHVTKKHPGTSTSAA